MAPIRQASKGLGALPRRLVNKHGACRLLGGTRLAQKVFMPRAVVMQSLSLWICIVASIGAQSAGASPYVNRYHLEPLHDGVSGLRGRFGQEQLELLEKINRSDVEHLGRLREIVVPDSWVSDELAYSVLPARYAASEKLSKLLVVYQPAQLFGAYEFGRLVRWGPISSGRRSAPTPSGLFRLNWRSTAHRSTRNPEWFMRWYFNFENRLGLSFHEYSLPGRPASHSCIRLLGRDARWLFSWGDPWTLDASQTRILQAGTPVYIIGQYDFDAPPSWRSVEEQIPNVELPDYVGSFQGTSFSFGARHFPTTILSSPQYVTL